MDRVSSSDSDHEAMKKRGLTTKARRDRIIGKGGFQTRPYETFVNFVSFVVKSVSASLIAVVPREVLYG